jgi:hypothetical protein
LAAVPPAKLETSTLHSWCWLLVPHVLQIQVDPEAELLLDLPDGFSRLLAHGLAEFHGLLSATRVEAGVRCVVLYAKTPKPVSDSAAGGSAAAAASSAANIGGWLEQRGQQQQQQVGSQQQQQQYMRKDHDTEVTCTDVIMALHELGTQEFNQHSLRQYMRTHVHGINSDVNSDDFVML